MFQYLFRRLLVAIPTLFVIITLAFFMVRAAPGGPFDQDRKIPPEIEANLNRVYHWMSRCTSSISAIWAMRRKAIWALLFSTLTAPSTR